jgi:hypothetical protein
MVTTARDQGTIVKKLVGGVVGGAAGGVVFGAMMGMMGMLPVLAGLAGSSEPVVGFVIHMLISLFIGVSFGAIFGDISSTYTRSAVWGLVYGGIWWVLGPLVIMPLMMGMGLQLAAAFSGPMLLSLMGHLIYGLVLGLGYAWYLRRF